MSRSHAQLRTKKTRPRAKTGEDLAVAHGRTHVEQLQKERAAKAAAEKKAGIPSMKALKKALALTKRPKRN